MEKILIEKQVWESTLNRSMVLEAENEQLKELLKRCKRHINASFPEIYRELLQEINQVLGEKNNDTETKKSF